MQRKSLSDSTQKKTYRDQENSAGTGRGKPPLIGTKFIGYCGVSHTHARKRLMLLIRETGLVMMLMITTIDHSDATRRFSKRMGSCQAVRSHKARRLNTKANRYQLVQQRIFLLETEPGTCDSKRQKSAELMPKTCCLVD